MNSGTTFVALLSPAAAATRVMPVCAVRSTNLVPQISCAGQFSHQLQSSRIFRYPVKLQRRLEFLVSRTANQTSAVDTVPVPQNMSSRAEVVDTTLSGSLPRLMSSETLADNGDVAFRGIDPLLDISGGNLSRTVAGIDQSVDSDARVVHSRTGTPHTVESKRKISEANKGNIPWNKGKNHTPETRRRIAEATRKAMNRPDVRMRLRALAKDRRHSTETKAKIATNCIRSRASLDKVQHFDITNANSHASILSFFAANSRSRIRRRNPVPFVYTTDHISKLNQRVLARKMDMKFTTTSHNDDANDAKQKRPMSLSTRAKLSARIKALWKDPGYRLRVREGVHANLRRSSFERRPLSDQHKERIRQTLLRRNAETRARLGLPEKGAIRRSSRTRRQEFDGEERKPSGADGGRTGSRGNPELKDQFLALKENEREMKVLRRRQLHRIRLNALEMQRRAAEERMRSKLLLHSLASAGQLPSLNDEGTTSGSTSFVPVLSDPNLFEPLAAQNDFSDSSDSSLSLARALSLSSNGYSSQDQVSETPASDMNGASSTADSTNLFGNIIGLDYDIYAPVPRVLDSEQDDDGDNFAAPDVTERGHRRKDYVKLKTGRKRKASAKALLSAEFVDDERDDARQYGGMPHGSAEENESPSDLDDMDDDEDDDESGFTNCTPRKKTLTESDINVSDLDFGAWDEDEEGIENSVNSSDNRRNDPESSEHPLTYPAAADTGSIADDSMLDNIGTFDRRELSRLEHVSRMKESQVAEQTRIVTYVNGKAEYVM